MFGLPLNFWLENLHFVIFVLVALGFFSAGWLNLDSHRNNPETKILIRVIGFFILAFWFLFSASGYSFGTNNWIVAGVELIGVAILAVSFYLEPMPDTINIKKKSLLFGPFSLPNLMVYITNLPIIGWFLLLCRVWLFSTKGLTKDFIGFRNGLVFVLLSRILSLADIFSGSSNIIIFNLTRQYSYLWILENALMLIAAIIILKWTFFYLRFRPTPKLFITFIATSILIFVIATVTFTGFLYSANQKNILETLKKNAAIFDFSIKELKKQNELAAYSLAQREQIINGAVENKFDQAVAGLGDPIKELQVGGAAITNRSGEILAVVGPYVSAHESLVNDPAVAKTLQGKITSSLAVERLIDTDQIVVRSAFPIVKDGKVYGAAVVDLPIDQIFVDNVKELTDLDVTINIGDVRSATTFIDYNQRRISGTKITNPHALALINENQKSPWAWSGAERIGSQAYLTVYRSLADSDNINIASLMVGQSQKQAIDEISSSIKLTFTSVSLLILISLLPLYYIAKSISQAQKV